MQITRYILAAAAAFAAFEGPASAQAMFTGSIGNVFGGDAPSTRKTWALAIGGSGAHGIGSELEYSQTENFFETPDGVAHGRILTLMPSIFVAVPINRLRPYGIFGFGFIRQRQRRRAAASPASRTTTLATTSEVVSFSNSPGAWACEATFAASRCERPTESAFSGSPSGSCWGVG